MSANCGYVNVKGEMRNGNGCIVCNGVYCRDVIRSKMGGHGAEERLTKAES